MTRNARRFLVLYTERLTIAVRANPSSYAYGVEKVPAISKRMVDSLTVGSALISGTVQGVCKELGIKPTRKDITKFLTTPDVDTQS